MDPALRNKLWSTLHIALFQYTSDGLRHRGIDSHATARTLWVDFFHRTADSVPSHGLSGLATAIRGWFFECDWHEVYDFIEALLAAIPGNSSGEVVAALNSGLEHEMSAYRIIDRMVVDITAEEEVKAIEDALSDASGTSVVYAHLRESLAKLTDRKNPDYRNSMKESISAVEATCRILTGDEKATLGAGLKRLKDAGVRIHPSLESGWSKLYGYTSDEGGIRHALSEEAESNFATAKYMLVMCSAFVSYLLALASDLQLELKEP